MKIRKKSKVENPERPKSRRSESGDEKLKISRKNPEKSKVEKRDRYFFHGMGYPGKKPPLLILCELRCFFSLFWLRTPQCANYGPGHSLWRDGRFRVNSVYYQWRFELIFFLFYIIFVIFFFDFMKFHLMKNLKLIKR